MEKITLKLWSLTQAAKDLPGVWAWIKAMLIAGHRLALEVRPEKRSDAQELRDLDDMCRAGRLPESIGTCGNVGEGEGC